MHPNEARTKRNVKDVTKKSILSNPDGKKTFSLSRRDSLAAKPCEMNLTLPNHAAT